MFIIHNLHVNLQCRKMLYTNYGERKYLTRSERSKFIRFCQRGDDPENTFCLVLAYSGCRLSEALALRPRNIDLDAGVIIFETLKKRRRGVYRAVPIPVNILKKLQTAEKKCSLPGERLFPWSRTKAWMIIKRRMKLISVEGKQATPKGLRHGFAVAALHAGAPLNLVQKWLGHSSIQITAIYADVLGPEERQFAKQLWDSA